MKTKLNQIRFTEDEENLIQKAILKWNEADTIGNTDKSKLIRKATIDFAKKILLAKEIEVLFKK